MKNLTKKIQNFAHTENLWQSNSKIVLGISGGGDSVFLLDFMSKLAIKYEIKLHLAHVNYGLRGKDSEKDETYVRELAKKYDLPITVMTIKKENVLLGSGGNMENVLRKIRYTFFEKLRTELEFDLISVAHTQDDQAETVLMRILRGSGLNGLSAIKAKSGRIVRPLLKTSKTEIISYLKKKNLKYRTDKTNFDLNFTRNKVRKNLLPYLEKNFNPNIKKTLSEWSFSVADDYDFIANSAQFLARYGCTKNKCTTFSATDFLALPNSIQRQELRNLYLKLKNGTEDVQSSQIEEFLKVIKSAKSKNQKAVISGLNISKKGVKIEIFC